MAKDKKYLISDRVNQLIKEYELKQNEVADRLHLTPQHFNAIIHGRYAIDKAYLDDLSDILDCDPEYLCGDSDIVYDVRKHDEERDEAEINKCVEYLFEIGLIDLDVNDRILIPLGCGHFLPLTKDEVTTLVENINSAADSAFHSFVRTVYCFSSNNSDPRIHNAFPLV